MSNKGVFIIRKNGVDKSLCIPTDAYPLNMAQNVVGLIRKAELNKIYEILIPSEFSQYFWFDAKLLLEYSESNKKLCHKDNSELLLDSLVCEYGYVIDLDNEQLEYYVGFQKEPQPGNRYGEKKTYTTVKGENYYPCRLVAVFSFRYVESALLRTIITNMENVHDSKKIQYFDAAPDSEKGIKEEIIPSNIMIYSKLEWIEEQISSTLEKHIDMGSRYEKALRDIDLMREQLNIIKIEIGSLQHDLEVLKRK